MQLTKRYSGILSVGSMITLLAAAYFFDNLIHALRHNSNPNGAVHFKLVLSGMWFTPILFFVLAICLLLLFSFVMYQGERNIVISVIFIIAGICVLFVPPLSYSGWWPAPVPPFMNWPGNDSWFLLGTSAFVAAIGVMGILFPKQKIQRRDPVPPILRDR